MIEREREIGGNCQTAKTEIGGCTLRYYWRGNWFGTGSWGRRGRGVGQDYVNINSMPHVDVKCWKLDLGVVTCKCFFLTCLCVLIVCF